MTAEPSEPRVVATFYSVEEAELARANLEGAGITAVVEGKYSTGVLPMHSLAMGGVRVVVQAKDLPAARELLGEGKGEAETTNEGESSIEQGESSTEEGDKEMRRAAFAAFMGLSACPGVGTAYAFVLLLRYGSLPLSARGRVHKRIAIACCLAMAAVAVMWRMGTR